MSSTSTSLRFRRAHSLPGAFVLLGIRSQSQFDAVLHHLSTSHCHIVACGSCVGSRFTWVCFMASAKVAGYFALTVPCDSAPLFVSVTSYALLSGAVESRCRAARGGRGSLNVAIQRQVGQPMLS